jgi:hypothetical protein
MTHTVIETFVNRLRERPWLEADWIAAIDQGLRTSVRDPDLWEKLRQVISNDDDEPLSEQLKQIGRIARAHLCNERARYASH